MNRYVIFLRGINIGPHKRIPMSDLKNMLGRMGYRDVVTILASGNIVLSSDTVKVSEMEQRIHAALHKTFSYDVDVIVRKMEDIQSLVSSDPFGDITIGDPAHWYVSFFSGKRKHDHLLPYQVIQGDSIYRIISEHDQIVCSVLQVGNMKTPDVMNILTKLYGKVITTRNWLTIQKIVKLCY